ncbi:MAG: energy transducer TonB [Methylococcales bacterium]|nr:energy transducer TonB [Methylococcales bacterium]
MFTKLFSPVANTYFLENRPVLVANTAHHKAASPNDCSWTALGLVFCAHLAAFAVLRPQSQSLPIETIPEPIMVSFLSVPQTKTQKFEPPPNLKQKIQKAVTPKTTQKKVIKTQVKHTPTVHKMPASKPIVARNQSLTPPVEQTPAPVTEANSQPIASTAATKVSKPADNAQSYQSPSFNAAYLNNPAPDYPSLSRRLGEQGKVLLHVQVTADGAAGSVSLQASSGSSRLDQAALSAVKQWRFVPAKRGGQTVSASVVVPVSFSLEG